MSYGNNDKRDSKKRDSKRDSRSSYGSLSDLRDSDEESSNKYKKMAKKLSKDKSELKDKLRKLIEDVETKNKEHRSELERTQEYFQDQILELTDQKNQLKMDLSKKDNKKELQTIKRLETTITTLQERLNNQTQELEQYKENLGQVSDEKEQQYRKTMMELQEQVKLAKEQELKIKKEFQNLINSCEKEKLFIADRVRLDKDSEINRINQEKVNAIRMCEMDKDFLEKKTREAEQRREKEFNDLKYNLEKSKKENERKVQDTIENCKKTIEAFQMDHDGKTNELIRQHNIDLENMVKECEKRLDSNTLENTKKMEVLGHVLGLEHEKLRRERDQAVIQMEKMFTDFIKKEDETARKHEYDLEKVQNNLKTRLELKEQELNGQKLKFDKTLGEATEINQKLGQQVSILRDNLKKVHDNALNVNNQFINSLNKQKETAEKEIYEKSMIISKLESDFKKIVYDTAEKIEIYEKKIVNFESDIKDISEKYLNIKNICEQKHSELEKHKDLLTKFGERTQILQFEKEQLDRRLQSLDSDYKIAETDRTKIKSDLVKFEQIELKNKEIVEENNKLRENYEKLRKDHSDIVISLTNEKKSNKQQESTIKQLTNTADRLEQDLNNKNRLVESSKKDLEATTKNLTTVNDEFSRMRASLLEDSRQKIMEIKGEHTKQIANLEKRVNQLEIERVNLTNLNASLTSERDKLKYMLDLSSQPNPDYVAKVQENKQLLEDIKQLRIELVRQQNDLGVKIIQTEEDCKKRIATINKKLVEQDSYISQQNSKMEILKEQYNTKLLETKKGTPEQQETFKKNLDDNSLLKKQLESCEQKLRLLQIEFSDEKAVIKSRTELLDKKENELREFERQLRSAPPKLLDPSIKKQKDDALVSVRQTKLEIGRQREEITNLTNKIHQLEKENKELKQKENVEGTV